jgi:hypothetical protein
MPRFILTKETFAQSTGFSGLVAKINIGLKVFAFRRTYGKMNFGCNNGAIKHIFNRHSQ